MACVSRRTWGAKGSVPRDGSRGKDTVAIHHTVSPNRSWSAEQERAHMRQLEAGHLARGFSTIGYSWVVFPSGRCYVGRGMEGLPAAQEGHNTGTWAIALVGDFRTAAQLRADGVRAAAQAPTTLARREVRRIIRLLRDGHGARRLGAHREFPGQSTECPGGRVLKFVVAWRAEFEMGPPV